MVAPSSLRRPFGLVQVSVLASLGFRSPAVGPGVSCLGSRLFFPRARHPASRRSSRAGEAPTRLCQHLPGRPVDKCMFAGATGLARRVPVELAGFLKPPLTEKRSPINPRILGQLAVRSTHINESERKPNRTDPPKGKGGRTRERAKETREPGTRKTRVRCAPFSMANDAGVGAGVGAHGNFDMSTHHSCSSSIQHQHGCPQSFTHVGVSLPSFFGSSLPFCLPLPLLP